MENCAKSPENSVGDPEHFLCFVRLPTRKKSVGPDIALFEVLDQKRQSVANGQMYFVRERVQRGSSTTRITGDA